MTVLKRIKHLVTIQMLDYQWEGVCTDKMMGGYMDPTLHPSSFTLDLSLRVIYSVIFTGYSSQ